MNPSIFKMRGVVYLNNPDLSDSEQKRDLDNIKAAGMNLVTLWPVSNPWLADDPGEFVFESTRKLMDACHERDLKVMLQLIGQNSAWEYMPDCFLETDMLVQHDESFLDHNWANYNHPKVDALIHRYFDEAVKALKDHPALFAWEAFNEAHWRSDDPVTVRIYQDWLKERYGDIKNLNRLWCRRYSSFSEVKIENRSDVYSVWSSVLPEVDYNHFQSQLLVRLVKRWREYIREFDTAHPVFQDVACHTYAMGQLTHRNEDEFSIARTSDFFGGSYYPKSHGQNLGNKPCELSLQFKLSHSAAKQAGKAFYVTELQTHTQSLLTPGSEVSPEELKSWIWSAILAGAKGYELWKWRPFLSGIQATGRGLTDIDGTPNARFDVITELNECLENLDLTIAAAEPAPPVATIVVNYRSRLFFDTFLRSRSEKDLHSRNLTGWYRLFWSLGIPIQFVELEFMSKGDFTTPLLVLPGMVSISDRNLDKLSDYVENGGHLIVDGRFCSLDEHGKVRPEGIPSRFFRNVSGCQEKDVEAEVSFLLEGTPVRNHFMTQHLMPLPGAEVMDDSKEGLARIVRNTYGNGSCLTIGAFMGASMCDTCCDSHKAFFLRYLQSLLPQLTWIEKSDRINAAMHQLSGENILLLYNAGNKEEQVTLRQLDSDPAGTDAMSGEPVSSRIIVTADNSRIIRLRPSSR